jgi:hypothetical protein
MTSIYLVFKVTVWVILSYVAWVIYKYARDRTAKKMSEYDTEMNVIAWKTDEHTKLYDSELD